LAPETTKSNDMTNPTICFIGGGNMATSLIGGLIANDYAAERIVATDIDASRLDQLRGQFTIRTESANEKAVATADIVILAVKPQVMQDVCRGIAQLENQPLFISIAAGIRATDIDRWLGGNRSIVRCMPNTPALVGLGASGLYANDAVSADQKQQAEAILNGVGISVWVDQEQALDAVTAISGSGPAYFFLFIEALQNAASEIGLDEQTAAQLARQTALGAATMAIGKDVVELRRQVTSKGGTTEQAILSFNQNGLGKLVLDAARAAERRSRELASELSRDS
jgi:pyrroline-5-carboxylate reductase